jgi:predicted AlkP superfamily pyrophosphatase or phosphodiesterase
MNIDNAGHKAGVDSAHYRNTVRHSDSELSKYLPRWIDEGYQVVITADHGMNDDKSHGGTLAKERDIPFFVIGERFSHQSSCAPKQTEICGVICELLGVQNHNKPVTDNLLLKQPQSVMATDRQCLKSVAL